MSDFITDLKEHWNDSYWWADHQVLMAILVGMIGLAFHAMTLMMDRAWTAVPDGT